MREREGGGQGDEGCELLETVKKEQEGWRREHSRHLLPLPWLQGENHQADCL